MNDDRRKQLDSLKSYLMKRSKDHLKKKFVDMAEPMNRVDYTRENYDKLFPNNNVSTPIGEVKMRRDQFIKLGTKDRENLLGAAHQTLTKPIAVINEDRNGKIAKLFSSNFTDNDVLKENEGVVAVVPKIKGKDTVVTIHPRRNNNVLNKIKNIGDVIYERSHAGTAGNNNNVTQLPNNIPQSLEDVKRNIAKANREALNNNNL